MDYYVKIYGISAREIVDSDESTCLAILFDMRNVIIHCSALSGKWIEEENRMYLYVDDPSYLELLKKVRKTMNMTERYYCLPESLLVWNDLVDRIVRSSHSAITKLSDQAI